jgi:hypothetical protein
MCTQKETEQAVRNVLKEKNTRGDTVVEDAVNNVLYKVDPKTGHTIIGKILDVHMADRENKIISGLTKRAIIPFVILLCSIAGTWFTLSSQVEQNTHFREGIEIITEKDLAVLQNQVDSLERRNDQFEAWLTRIETKVDIIIQR